MVGSSPPLQLVDVGTAANVLLVRGTSLGQDNGWELHVPSEVCLVCVWGGEVGTHHKLQSIMLFTKFHKWSTFTNTSFACMYVW